MKDFYCRQVCVSKPFKLGSLCLEPCVSRPSPKKLAQEEIFICYEIEREIWAHLCIPFFLFLWVEENKLLSSLLFRDANDF